MTTQQTTTVGQPSTALAGGAGPHAPHAPLPQLTGGPYITDGGLETSLVFQQGLDLVDFAAFPLIDSPRGQEALRRYYEPYFELAGTLDVGLVIDTPTWRANLDWGARQGFDAQAMAEINARAVHLVDEVAASWPTVETIVNGAMGPRGDGYLVGSTMSVEDAAGYHSLQTEAFARAGAAMVTAVTMTYVEEAVGIAVAARASAIPAVVSFTVETDGRLPSGQPLGEAIEQVDSLTDASPAYFMVNCAHPSHFDHVLRRDEPWVGRVRGIRANASSLSHAELDEATDLDRGDIADLAARYADLCRRLPELVVVGGCCGTDHEHVAAIAGAIPRPVAGGDRATARGGPRPGL